MTTPDDNSPYRVGLTGGVASGKSTVAAAFAKLSAQVIDADRVARDVVAAGEPALAEIAAAFGAGILAADGSLDRHAMRQRVFSDAAARRKLEAIIHPRVVEYMISRPLADDAAYQILMAPLLIEAGMVRHVHRVLVVDCSPTTQLARLTARDDVSREQAQRILDAQLDREQRLAQADDVFVNDGALSQIADSVRVLDREYRRLARNRALTLPKMRLP